MKLLNTAEAGAIPLVKPYLCVQKTFVQAPWPSNHQHGQVGEHTRTIQQTGAAVQTASHQQADRIKQHDYSPSPLCYHASYLTIFMIAQLVEYSPSKRVVAGSRHAQGCNFSSILEAFNLVYANPITFVIYFHIFKSPMRNIEQIIRSDVCFEYLCGNIPTNYQ